MKNVSLALVLGSVLAGCGGASPGNTPEETANEYANLWIERKLDQRDRSIENYLKDLDEEEDQRSLWADRGRFQKDREEPESRIEFVEENRSAYDDITFDITDIRANKNGTRTVVLKFWLNEPKSGGQPNSYYLMPTPVSVKLEMAEIDGEWLILKKH